jgi:DNA repair exonuclease SbcCD ATPase subunit
MDQVDVLSPEVKHRMEQVAIGVFRDQIALRNKELAEERAIILREMAKQFGQVWQAIGALTEAQKRTEQRVNELTEAQKRTEQRVDGLTEAQKRIEERLERLEVTMQALAEAQQRTEQRVNELAEAQKRTEERLERLEATVQALIEAQQRTEQRVNELAEAQKRTEQRVNELAEAQKRTEERLERLEATVQALTEAQQRTEQRVNELVEAQKRTEQRVNELTEAQKRTEQRVNELVEAQKRTEEAVAAMSKQLGQLSRRFGLEVEVDAEEILYDVLTKKGYRFLSEPEAVIVDGEADIVAQVETLQGERFWVLVEVKGRLRRAETGEWLAQLKNPSYLDMLRSKGITSPYLPYAFGLRVYEGVLPLAESTGLGVLDWHGERLPPRPWTGKRGD